MSLISFPFFVFVLVLMAAYYLMPCKWQWVVIPVFNLLFYMSYGAVAVCFLAVTMFLTYAMGILLNRTDDHFGALRKACADKEQKKKYKADCVKTKKRIMLVGLFVDFVLWFLFKFTGLFSFSPLGISIYTFIAAGYCIDVYRGKYRAEKNLFKYASFLSFFPHIVQGPFSRYDALKDTLFAGRRCSFERLEQGIIRIVWGCFKKLVIADRMKAAIDMILPRDSGYGGVYVFLLFVILPIQLYADFSGYMDIVAGICHMLGIRLQENFKQPFFARSIDEFWRRWHITLGAWFRDYLFYPVSMSRVVQKISARCKDKLSPVLVRMIPSYIALFFVWSATGLWHGKSWNFLLWGWINLLCIVSGMQFKPFYERIKGRLHITEENKCWRLFQMARTFLIFGFAEMVSDIPSIYGIWTKCRSLVCEHNWYLAARPLQLFPGLEIRDLVILGIGILLMLILDILKEKNVDIYGLAGRIPVFFRYLGYVSLFYAVILLGYSGKNAAGGFMYEQF